MEYAQPSSAEHIQVAWRYPTMLYKAPAYFAPSICGEYKILAMLARKQMKEAEWEHKFRTEEAQQLFVRSLISNTPLKRWMKQARYDVTSAHKGVALVAMFPCVGFRHLVSRYSGVVMQDELLHVAEMAAATNRILRKFSGTDE